MRGYDLAEKLCAYFQAWAKNYVEPGSGGKIELKLSLREKFLIATSTPILDLLASKNPLAKLIPKKIWGARAVAYKLLLATQMDFYRENPAYIAVFGLSDDASKLKMFQELQDMHDKLGPTYGPVDKYFEDSFSRLKAWAPTYLAPPHPTPKLTPKP